MTSRRCRGRSAGPASSLILLAALSLGLGAPAHAHQIANGPVILYRFYNEQNCNNCGPGPWETSFSAAWADAQAIVASVAPAGSQTAVGPVIPQPNYPTYNGVPTQYNFSIKECSGGSCTTFQNIGYITTAVACESPTNFAANQQNSGTYPTFTTQCLITIPDVQAPPKYCKTCTGNPIYPASGQKVQPETDYSGAPGMSFVRTYSSNNGYFSSVLTQAFLNNSSSGVPSGCLQAAWSYSGGSGTFCFPYVNSYPNLPAQYEVQTPEGWSLQFTGPNNAVTQAADINDRVTMLTVNGATQWQVHREDDTIELYNASGELIQKTLLGGRVLTYTYSTSSTPPSIAPFPGLLLTQSDPFGHALSWQYNTAGEVSQMTDPAGGIYTYGYDGIGNLTSVTYPDNTVRTYWYNESANTSGANLPNTLTGITDESSTRYATFQYRAPAAGRYPPFALNTQHAGGVESYSIAYNGGAYYGGGITTATVTDPLGTQRTYQYANNLSYNDDTSQTQPAASGSGTVTQSESYDANGNPNQVTDYQGNITKSVYDQTRNLETSRTEAYGTSSVRTITTMWDGNWRQPALVSIYNNGTGTGTPIKTTAFTYDSLGNVLTKTVTDTSVTPNVARTWTYTYDTYGRMRTAKGPRTDVNSTTTYTYYTCTTGYQCGMLQTVTDPAGNVTTYNTYNAHGQPLTITDPNNVVTTLGYDARLRLTLELTRFGGQVFVLAL